MCLKRFSRPAGRTHIHGLSLGGGRRGGSRAPLCCLGGAASPLPRPEAPLSPSHAPGLPPAKALSGLWWRTVDRRMGSSVVVIYSTVSLLRLSAV